MPNQQNSNLTFQNASPLQMGQAMAASNPSGAMGWNPGQYQQIEAADLAKIFMQIVPHLVAFGQLGLSPGQFDMPFQGTAPGQPTVDRMQTLDKMASQYTAQRAQGDVDKAKLARVAAAKRKINRK